MQALADYYQRGGNPFGAIDLLLVGPNSNDGILPELLLLLMWATSNDGALFKRIVVTLPPIETTAENAIRARIDQLVLELTGKALEDRELSALKQRIRFVQTKDYDIDSVMEQLVSLGREDVAVICNAAAYRDPGVVRTSLPEETAGLEEDIWARQLHSLCSRTLQIARERSMYVALEARRWAPTRTGNLELLHSIEGCGVFGGQAPEGPEYYVATLADEWVRLARSGQSDEALALIDALPKSMESQKLILKAQILHRADRLKDAAAMIQLQLKGGKALDPNISAHLSQIAATAGDAQLVHELLAPVLRDLKDQEYLEKGLFSAVTIGARDLENSCLQALNRHFPRSARLRERAVSQLLQASHALGSGVPEVFNGGPLDLASLREFLLSTLGTEATPRYDKMVEEARTKWPNLASIAKLACAVNAFARGLPDFAMALASPTEFGNNDYLGKRATNVLLDSLERVLVGRRNDFHADVLRAPLLDLVGYLATHPSDAAVRVRLTRVLSVQTAGTIGLAALALTVLELASDGIARDETPPLTSPEVSAEEFYEFFRNVLEWIARNSAFNIAKASLPKDLISASPDGLLDFLGRLAQRVGELEGEKADLAFLEQVAFVGVLLAPHSNSPNEDLVLIRLAAGRLALGGNFQRGRDFAEQGLVMAGEDPLRARLAWFAFADTYQRSNNLLEALIGLSCTFACDVAITVEQAWYEANALIRLLRDLGLVDQAKRALPHARKLLEVGGFAEKFGHRLDTIEIGLRLRTLGTDPEVTPQEVAQLVNDSEANCQSALEERDELLPSATLLAQSMALARALNVAVESGAIATLEKALGILHIKAATFVRVTSEGSPTASDVLELAGRVHEARYSEDAGFDMRSVVLAAHRLLGSEAARQDSTVAAFAIELMADHTISPPSAVPAPIDSGRSHWLVSSIEGPATLLRDLSKADLDISLIGLDSSERLVHVTAQQGVLGDTVSEDTAAFSEARLSVWTRKYPYDYGTQDDVGNLFYTSMAGLSMNLPPSHRTLVILDTRLQQLPPNLLMVRDEFIGRGTAMASAPSLSWLAAARNRPPDTSGLMNAWISTIEGEESSGTLALLAGRLETDLLKHGVTLETAASVPDRLARSELAIIGAHGSVSAEGRYFQAVTDEAGLKLSPISLSQAVGGARVVVLFVCSGGRFDKHPLASATVGLPRELLDRGCRAVLASPWPLNVSVAAHWLPAFLDRWTRGEAVIDANFQANKAVEAALGDSPGLCLAMNLFGDPLTRRLPPQEMMGGVGSPISKGYTA
jgi:hypothetical protein